LLSLSASPALAQTAQADPLARAATEAGAQVSETGLVYRAIKEGSGPSPAATDTVRVHYRGTFTDGKELTVPTHAANRRAFRSTASSSAGPKVCSA